MPRLTEKAHCMACALAIIEEWFKRWPESDEISNQPGSSGLPLTEGEKTQWRGLVALVVKKLSVEKENLAPKGTSGGQCRCGK
jgi:hypothetical protein